MGFPERCKAGALASLAGKYAQAAQFGRALQIAAGITNGEANRFYRHRALNEIAAGYLHHGQKERALEVLSQALESHGASTRIARTYAAAGELGEALNVAKNAEDYDQAEVLADRFARAERYEQALEIAAGIGDTSHKARALARIGARYPRPGQKVSERARRVLSRIARNPGGRE
jgi:DNA-directed RNA polymerase subunit K/omega